MSYPYGPQQGYPPTGNPPHATPGLPPGYAGVGPRGFGHGDGVAAHHGGPNGPAHGYAPSTASGATAITGAVLAVPVALATLVGAVMTYRSFDAGFCLAGTFAQESSSSVECLVLALGPGALVYLVACTIVSVLLLVGALLLFARTTAGRVIVAVSAALTTLVAVATSVIGSDSLSSVYGYLIGLTPAALSMFPLVFAVAPSTGRWIRAAR